MKIVFQMTALCALGFSVVLITGSFLEAAQPTAAPAAMSASDSASDQDQQTTQKPKRHKRPKRRSGGYETAEVKKGGTIEGVVLYKGKIPKPRKIQVVKDHQVCDQRDKIRPRMKVNDQQQVEEVVVFLGDIHKGKALLTPDTMPVVDQSSCTFVPHVQVVIQNQPFEIVNSDPLPHSAHLTQHRMSVYNRMQPQQNMRSKVTFDDVGLAILKCDVHDWMRAYLYVLWHPYYVVTGSEGGFRLDDVPPGDYELVAWQETLGEYTLPVTVKPGEVTQLQLELTRK